MSRRFPRTLSMRDLNPNDVIILFLGPTGAGKSTFINTAIRDDKLPVGHTLESQTKVPQVVRYRDGNQDVVFIDTPCYGCLSPPYELGKNRVTSGLDILLYDSRIHSLRFEGTAESAWDIIHNAVAEVNVRLQRECADHSLLESTRLTRSEQICFFEEHIQRYQELSNIARELFRELSKAEGDATLKNERHRVEDLINQSMMQIQGTHEVLVQEKMTLTSIGTELALMLEQARLASSGTTLQISDPLMTDAASIRMESTSTISSRDSASLSSDETYHSVATHPDASGCTSESEGGGYPFASTAALGTPQLNSPNSSRVAIDSCDTASFVSCKSSLYSMQASIRSTDEIAVMSRVERLASQLSHSINHLAQIIAEARRINPAQVNINEGDNYFGPIYNSGGFVGGRNNFNNLNNAANGLVELRYAFDRVTQITAQRTTQPQL
ncbi:hypothetical protein EYR38_005979 [Pleurotus pulmonarius]|nr:hypothetical protein EYR38_005979 [Pleurotus pulmonarius]